MEMPPILLRNIILVHDWLGDAYGNVRVEDALVTVIGKDKWTFVHE